jgi:dTDP-4-dehydrorhamnose reductase
MKALITGASGMTGAELTRQARAKGWDATALTRKDLDVSELPAVEDAVGRAHPDVIFNAAAYTAVDSAEDDAEAAMAVNGTGAGNVALAARENHALMIHISTDYVFNGENPLPCKPDDRVAPLNVYGESKLAGEIAVRAECPDHVIVRTSWVYSHEGRNFVRTMLRAADEGRELRVVNDQRGCPTSSADLAAALITVAERAREAGATGTYHFCNAGATTWYDFAREIFRIRGIDPKLQPISTEDFAAKAKRPRASVLDCTSFTSAFGVEPRPWEVALKDTMERIS